MVEKLNEILKNAMKAKDVLLVKFARNLISELSATQKRSVKDLSQGEINTLLNKLVKQRNESNEAFIKAGNHEQALEEQQEAAFIQQFLPAYITDNELDTKISNFVDNSFTKEEIKTNKSLMGLTIKAIKTQIEEANLNVDSKNLSEKVKSYFTNA